MQPRKLSDVMPDFPHRNIAVAPQGEMNDDAKQVFKALTDGGFPALHQRTYREGRLSGGEWAMKAEILHNHIASCDGCLVALVGPRGTGKTQMATVAAAKYQKRMIPKGLVGIARYVRTMEFFMAVKDAYASSTSERDAFEPYTRPRLLVLDEVQVRNESKWEDNALTYLVDTRYGDCKKTILISNQTPEGFSESMGDSIMSRLSESGSVILCNWKSFRGQG